MKKTDKKKQSSLPLEGSGKGLEWLPKWEGVLMFDPEDLRQDRPVRIWHVITRKSKRHGVQRLRYELKPLLCRYGNKASLTDCLRPRCMYQFWHKGKTISLYRYHATMLAYFAFEPENPRLWVTDHYDNNTLNDRPSNLSYISQRENLSRSEAYRETRKLSPAENKRRAQIRMAWKERMRPHVIATIGPGATAIDVEMELTQLLIEHEFDYGPTPNPSPVREGNRNT